MTLNEAAAIPTTSFTQKRTAADPEAFVAEFGDRFEYGNKVYRVTLDSIDGETKSGRKRFTVRFTEVR